MADAPTTTSKPMRIVRGNPTAGYGLRPDPKNSSYKPFEGHPSCGLAAPDEVDLGPFMPAPWNQGMTASGTAHAFAGAVTVALASHGRALPSPAWPRGIYWLTRLLALPVAESEPAAKADPAKKSEKIVVADIGSSVWWTMHALRTKGIPTNRAETLDMDVRGEEYARFLAAKINEPIAESSLGLVVSPLDFHFIVGDSPKDRIDKIASALATGYPVLASLDASHPDFQAHNGSGVIDAWGETPNQMVYLCGMRTVRKKTPKEAREFKLAISWGWREWTHDSTGWISERFAVSGLSGLLVPRIL